LRFITVSPNGRVWGIDTNNQLYTKREKSETWNKIHDGPFLTVATTILNKNLVI